MKNSILILVGVLKSLRPKQWIKNFFIFAPLIFSQNVFSLSLFLKTVLAFVIFCIVSGSLYILNDLMDLEEDKRHPVKSKRPLASGQLKKSHAILPIFLFCISGLMLALLLNMYFFLITVIYFLLQLAYSIRLKHVVILDVLIVAFGFLIRVIAGGLAIEVHISSWLLICTILLALFLALGKRRHELVILEDEASHHRPILSQYSPYLLDQMISVVTASSLLSYCLYTISEETVEKFGTTNLIFTVPFVLYGIFRYLYIIHQKDEGGSPEVLIIKDKPLLIDIFLWVLVSFVILYIKW